MSRVVRGMEVVYQRVPGDIGGSARNMGNGGHNQRSHLQLFGQAKEQIDDIFKEIGQFVQETDTLVDEIGTTFQEILPADVSAKVKGYKEKVQDIREVIQRKGMKVVVFGRTSNGKSTVINAMLRDEIMPSEVGHTTHCFIQVEGSDSREACLLTEESDQPKNLELLEQLANNLSDQRLKSNSLIRIRWPKDKCRLLREDVVFVDSPGVDIDTYNDFWIDQFCMDADVFVLVASAVSTLTQTEKNFFHKVSSRLSKPNIFVLQNRWDECAKAKKVEDVRRQHMERSIAFLVDELKVVDKKTAEDRVFFVSAREALVSRLQQDKETPVPSGVLRIGYEKRLSEFAKFENQFEQCISKSAVKTKFEQHTVSGKSITSDVRGIMEQAYTTSLQLKSKKALEEEETGRLSALVEQYDQPFCADKVKDYKKGLNARVKEEEIGRDLKDAFLASINTIEARMADQLPSILRNETRPMPYDLIPNRDDWMARALNCHNLYEDFEEDLNFKLPSSLQLTETQVAYLQAAGAVACVAAINIETVAPAAPVVPAVICSVNMLPKVWEWWVWTDKQKGKAFKQQYKMYVSSKLTDIKSECRSMVDGELSSNFDQLCQQVKRTKDQLQEDLDQLNVTISKLGEISGKSKSLRDKADRLDGELNTFVETYLKE